MIVYEQNAFLQCCFNINIKLYRVVLTFEPIDEPLSAFIKMNAAAAYFPVMLFKVVVFLRIWRKFQRAIIQVNATEKYVLRHDTFIALYKNIEAANVEIYESGLNITFLVSSPYLRCGVS